MNLLDKREIASVQLFEVEISESELDTYRRLLLHVLEHLDAKAIERLFGDEPEELEGLLDDIENIMEEADLPIDKEHERREFVAAVKNDKVQIR